jgi:anti-sigma regulatory factor (Ser/Thr protein kinase)
MARRVIADACGCWGCAESVKADAQLLATEMVTNAVLHGRGRIELMVEPMRRGGLHVQVCDDGPGITRVPEPASGEQDESGRGFEIIDALATRWGFDGSGMRSMVWFDVA